jgi:hypothetical protein
MAFLSSTMTMVTTASSTLPCPVQRHEPKPNNPRDEFPDLIDWTALPQDHLLTPPKFFFVRPEKNSPLRGNSHLPGGPQIVPPRGSSIHTRGPHKPCPCRGPKPLIPVVWGEYTR